MTLHSNYTPMTSHTLNMAEGAFNPMAATLSGMALADVPQGTEGTKHDSGKPEMALVPAEAIEEIAKAFTFGAKKYSPNNWRRGFKWTRVGSALLRHVFSWLKGEDNDPESGLSHLAHAGACICFLLTFVVTKTGEDDRYQPA